MFSGYFECEINKCPKMNPCMQYINLQSSGVKCFHPTTRSVLPKTLPNFTSSGLSIGAMLNRRTISIYYGRPHAGRWMNEVRAFCRIAGKKKGGEKGGEDRRKPSDFSLFFCSPLAWCCVKQTLLITECSKWNKKHMSGIFEADRTCRKTRERQGTIKKKKKAKTTPETKNTSFAMSKTSEPAAEWPVVLVGSFFICAIAYGKQTPCSLKTADSCRNGEGRGGRFFPHLVGWFFSFFPTHSRAV